MPIKKKLESGLKLLWDTLRLPLTICWIFIIAGMAFGYGVSMSDTYKSLLSDRYLIITSVRKDLEEGEDNAD